MFKKITLLVLCAALTLHTAQAQIKAFDEIKSADGQTGVQVGLSPKKTLVYQLTFKGKVAINWSALGLETDVVKPELPVTVLHTDKNKHQETFAWPLGENASVVNNYQERIFHCQTGATKFDVVMRVFNGSLAFKYVYHDLKTSVRLFKESTQFNLAANATIYQYHEESVFRPMPVDSLPGISDFPSTLAADNGLFMSIGEAENRGYTKCVMIKGEQPHSLALQFYTDTLYRDHRVTAIKKDTLVTFRDSLISPWRTISCAESAIGLHDFADLNLKLVTPVTNQVPSDIRPGKVFRVPITTEGAIEGADFAQRNNFQYILLDGGWYGAEFRTVSDPTKPIPGLDLPQVISHAKAKGIGVILYVNYVVLKQKIDTILPLYKSWGVSGLKFGFVDGGTQEGLTWLDDAMRKVDNYGFILNVHDHYKPTGLSRRYPYNLSQEGIRGDENSPDAFHNTVLPFTRYLAGPADFTFCYPNSKNAFGKNLKVSKGQQLALTVIYFDPLQAIYWYGKAADYTESQENEFFKYVPTVWDETHYLAGEIGKNISVARKKDNVWYVGCATGLAPWQAALKLDFLTAGQQYQATIYEDDGHKGIHVKTIKYKKGDMLKAEIDASGGMAMILRPVN